MIHGFLICMALALVVGAFLAIAACIVGGRTGRESLPGDPVVSPTEPDAPWALFDAPEFREALTDYLNAVDACILRHFEETARAEAAQLDDEDAVARWLEATS
jgi:hypothetical protein